MSHPAPIPVIGREDFAAAREQRLATDRLVRRLAKGRAEHAEREAEAAFIAAMDHPQALETACDIRDLAERIVGQVRDMADLEPAFCRVGQRRPGEVDRAELLTAFIELATERMTREAATLFTAVARRATA